ncbi:9204_t:CDS:2 [Diversispora eburnea]|uniref:9204_t:CDS:1 n=1 Tax=Diversispora eburnea TaxID=1213867 RepID=A0A9N9FHI9_9GLOM|nr:9204_t:CDS:2 [Diversispora eburnea]
MEMVKVLEMESGTSTPRKFNSDTTNNGSETNTTTSICHLYDTVHICSYCHAKLFSTETQGMYYRSEKIRAYNCGFAFTSIGIKLDKDLANGRDGVYIFQIQSGIYLSIRSLTPTDRISKFLQLYIYDMEFAQLTDFNNIADLYLHIKADHSLDQCMYNMPTSSQVATRVSELSGTYDPML